MNFYRKTKHIPRLLLAAFIAVMLVTLFGCGDSTTSAASGFNTTVLVYMIGTDLESKEGQASSNIQEMMTIGSTPNMNVVIQTGGANKPATSTAAPGSVESINWTNIQRYVVEQGSIALVPGGDLGPDNATNPSLDMGNQQTLSDFVKWGVSNYPAQKYIVVLWDHGGGVNSGVGSDEITKHSITTPQISNALQQVVTSQKVQFEIVGFDACLMATAEVAASLINTAKYMVSSEDLEPGGGWDWNGFLNYVTNNSSATGLQIGTAIVDSYVKKMTTTQTANNRQEQIVTLSVVDLSKIQAVIDTTNTFAQALSGITMDAPTWKQIAQARLHSLDWVTSALFSQAYDLVDMMVFSQNVVNGVKANGVAYPAVTSAGNNLALAIQSAVVYKNATNESPDSIATGLTVYFPSILSLFDSAYAANTTTDGTKSYFASNYSGSNGFVANYVKFYQDSLLPGSTTPALNTTVSDPLNTAPYAATVSNDFDFVLAAYQSLGCAVYDVTGAPIATTKCYDAISDNVVLDQLIAPNWNASFTAKTNWVFIDGTNYSVPMIPDQTAPKIGNSANYGRYLIPVFYNYTNPKTQITTYTPGFLLVEQSYPIQSGFTTPFMITAFQSFTPNTGALGKTLPLESGEIYSLGAYYCATTSSSCAFGRTKNSVSITATNPPLKLKYGSVPTGGNFGYIVNDLTGTISLSNQVTY